MDNVMEIMAPDLSKIIDIAKTNLKYVTEVYNVKGFGAKGDGFNDDTVAIQATINAASSSPNIPVYFPSGRYLINGSLVMALGVKLIGDSTTSSVVPGTGISRILSGSILLFTNIVLPGIVYTSGNHFEGLTIYYPNQVTTGTPTVYPATFKGSPDAQTGLVIRVNFYNINFVNPYIFIDASIGHLDFEFKDLVGCSIYRGIIIDGGGGTDILSNIRDSYFYYVQASNTLQTWMQANATGLSVGRCDAIHMLRIYFGSKNVGVRLYKGAVNTLGGCYGSIVGLSLDGNNYGLYVEETHAIGVDIVDMMCNSITFDIEVQSTTTVSCLQISNSKFWAAKAQIVRMNGTSFIDFNGCTFFSATAQSISVSGLGCRLTVKGCQFRDTTVSPVTTTVTLDEFVFVDNSIPAVPILNSTIATNTIIKDNTFLATNSGVIASASIITLPLNDRVTITGSVAINTINGGWTGRIVYLLFNNAGCVVTQSGNVVKTISPAQYQTVRAYCTGSTWLLD